MTVNATGCGCVQFSLKEMRYLMFYFLRTEVEIKFRLQRAISSEFGRKWRTEPTTDRRTRPTLLQLTNNKYKFIIYIVSFYFMLNFIAVSVTKNFIYFDYAAKFIQNAAKAMHKYLVFFDCGDLEA